MAKNTEPISSRLPAHAEHYATVETEYDAVFNDIKQTIDPLIAPYLEAGLAPELLKGATLKLDKNLTEKIDITFGIKEDKDITAYFMSYETTGKDGEKIRLGAPLHSVIKQHDPNAFVKYHGDEYLKNARVIADKLTNTEYTVMGLELRPIRAYPTNIVQTLGKTAV